MQVGLEKLLAAESEVNIMKQELTDLQPKLIETGEDHLHVFNIMPQWSPWQPQNIECKMVKHMVFSLQAARFARNIFEPQLYVPDNVCSCECLICCCHHFHQHHH